MRGSVLGLGVSRDEPDARPHHQCPNLHPWLGARQRQVMAARARVQTPKTTHHATGATKQMHGPRADEIDGPDARDVAEPAGACPHPVCSDREDEGGDGHRHDDVGREARAASQ